LIDRATGVAAHLVLDHGVGVALQEDREGVVAVQETVGDVFAIVRATAEDAVLPVAE